MSAPTQPASPSQTRLTEAGEAQVADIAARHGFSTEAVTHMLIALHQGGGTQAQFNHWEFGGMGQWSVGGMTMIGDMFNSGLKARVEAICADLSNALTGTRVFQPAPAAQQMQRGGYQSQSQSGGGGMQMQGNGFGNAFGSGFGGGSSLFVSGGGGADWWPEGLGQPGSTGAQNDMRYAYFPQSGRLAIDVHGTVTVYDTGAHQIGGFGQQQSGDQSLTFTSQFGLVRVADLPVVDMAAPTPGQPDAPRDPQTPPPAETPQEVPQDSPAEAPDDAPGEAPPAPPQETPVERPPLETPVKRPGESGAAPRQPGAVASGLTDGDAIFAALEKLGALRDMGVLTEAEFNAKKTELLSRL
jgi:hypothetical protein